MRVKILTAALSALCFAACQRPDPAEISYVGTWNILSISASSAGEDSSLADPESLRSLMLTLAKQNKLGLQKLTVVSNSMWMHYTDGTTDDTLRFHAVSTRDGNYILRNENGSPIGKMEFRNGGICDLTIGWYVFHLSRGQAQS